jgi:hypothetical protein
MSHLLIVFFKKKKKQKLRELQIRYRGPESCILPFVRQLPKLSSIQYRSSITGRNGPGGI